MRVRWDSVHGNGKLQASPQAAAISPDVIGVTVSTLGTKGCFAYCFRREAGPLLILAIFSGC